LGYELDPGDAVRAKVADNLTGTELTEALRAYVDRINRNPDDPALQVGTGKDLDEAVARHVLEQADETSRLGTRSGVEARDFSRRSFWDGPTDPLRPLSMRQVSEAVSEPGSRVGATESAVRQPSGGGVG
jgi:hypothetical protein